MAENFEDLKKIIKNRFLSESKNSFGERLCLMCRFGYEKIIKIRYGHFAPKKEQEK